MRTFLLLLLLAAGCNAAQGSFMVGWDILEHGVQSNCRLVRAARVELTAVGLRYGDRYEFSFDCLAENNGYGTVPSDDTYALSYRLVDAAGVTLATDDQGGALEVAPGWEVSWPFALLEVSVPRASFRTRFGDRDDSCAGVTSQEVRLADIAGAQCLDVTIDRIKGTYGTGPGKVCRLLPCQPESQTNVFLRMWPGSFTVEVIGYEGPKEAPVPRYRSAPVAFTIGSGDVDLGVIAAAEIP